MSTPILPVPEKSCETCGTPMTRKRFGKRLEDRSVFMRRRFCGPTCASTKPVVGKSAHHWRAKKFRAAKCSECPVTEALHVHHLDRNHENDDPSNLVTLCASCHLKLHWREDRPLRMAGARKAQETAKRTGGSTRPRSTDGRWSSAG